MFKVDFKYYKSRCSSPDLSNVIDLHHVDTSRHQFKLRAVAENVSTQNDGDGYGLKSISEWRMYELLNNPGLLFIENPFTTAGQRHWICRCLKDFTQKPSRLNLDSHGDLGPHENWWDVCYKDNARKANLLSKLRWATLGYHHNWNTKVYSEDAHDQFPDDLATLSKYVTEICGFEHFLPEAAIINFYHMDSTLSGHTDHSEVNKEAPIISFSFGQSAIFLLGGPEINDKPTAMMIHSGDIIIMSGHSRLCYHGVPRIMPAPKSPWNEIPVEFNEEVLEKNVSESMTNYVNPRNTSSFCSNNDKKCMQVRNMLRDNKNVCKCKFLVQNCEQCMWEPLECYIKTSRININVRQVLPSGCKFLSHN